MWNVKIQFRISSRQKAFFEQYSWTLNTHSIYHKESTLLWQILDFSTNHLPPSDLSLPRFLPKAVILLSQPKYQIWLKTSRLSWEMLMSVKSHSLLACVMIFQTALLQVPYMLPSTKQQPPLVTLSLLELKLWFSHSSKQEQGHSSEDHF